MKAYIIALLLVIPIFSHAFDDQPACYKLMQTNFFDPIIVAQALNFYGVPQTSWPTIQTMLQQQAQVVPQMIKQQTDLMLQSPLDYPFNRDEAAKLLWEELYQVFYAVMQASKVNASTNILNEYDLVGMFNYIRDQQEYKWINCLGTGWKGNEGE